MRCLPNKIIVLIKPLTLEEFLESTIEESAKKCGEDAQTIRLVNKAIYDVYDRRLKNAGDFDNLDETGVYVGRGFNGMLYIYKK